MRLLFLVTGVVLAANIVVVNCEKDWSETALVYQIYPRSFKDSDGDGIGDLNGIKEKLPFLQETGVDAIWLSPIYLSPMYDFGYDITDYRQIAPEYGTIEDFDNLMAEAKKLGIRIIMDFVPNHTSNESEWFIKSAERQPGYENYYVWADGKADPQDPSKTLPPNNWVSVFRKSAWEYNPVRKQYYLHQFVIGQPDLNYRDPRVQQEMKDVIRFWLDKGVSGFRIDAINFMYEADPEKYGGVFPDEPVSGDPNTGPDDYEYLDHVFTKNQDETYDVVYDWRQLLNEYTQKVEHKLMVTEGYADLNMVMRYYGDGKREGSVPFNFNLIEGVKNTSNARDIKVVIDQWMTYMPNGKTANWVNGNHDQNRMASRQGTDRVDAMNMIALLLPGVAFTYQGEELGMTDGEVSWQDTKDPQACNTDDPVNYWKKSRDPERTPYHWDDSTHAGFSDTKGETWLPVASNYKELNLAKQKSADKSHYKFYKDLVTIRKTSAVRLGDLETRAVSENVLAVVRLLENAPAVVGVVNLSASEETADLSSIRLLPSQLEVVTSGVDSNLQKGTTFNKSAVKVPAHSAVVLQSKTNVPVINI